MFWNTLSVENTKILKRRMLWIEIGILSVLIIVLYTIIYATVQTSSAVQMDSESRQEALSLIEWPGALLNSLGLSSGNSLGGLLLMVLIGAATAQEYTWRTMHLWLSRGLSRPVLMVAKYVAVLVPIILIVLTPLIVGGVLTGIFTLQIEKSLPFGQVNWWQLGMSALRTAYTLLPYAALTFMVAIVTRSAAAAIGVSVAYTLLVEGVASMVFTMLGGILRDIVVYLPGSLADGLLTLNATAIGGQEVFSGNGTGLINYLAPIPSAIGLALWTILFLGMAVWSFRRQDLAD
jgi:ABC-type transport system involved in multi-copper enzyme maturation permease subunit